MVQKKSNKGQALVETAIVMPLILLLIMGMIDFGLTFSNYMSIISASREAARLAAVGGTDQEIKTTVNNLTSTLDQANVSVTIIPAEASRTAGEKVDITVIYNNKFITPIISAIFSNNFNLTSKTTMRVEG